MASPINVSSIEIRDRRRGYDPRKRSWNYVEPWLGGEWTLRDILNVLSRRYPLSEVLLSPTQVQGDAAPPQIVAAIKAANERTDIDVLIIARGGGSLEDLWAFNDEQVARALGVVLRLDAPADPYMACAVEDEKAHAGAVGGGFGF